MDDRGPDHLACLHWSYQHHRSGAWPLRTLELHPSSSPGQKLEIRDASQLKIPAVLGRHRSNLPGPNLDRLCFIAAEPNKLRFIVILHYPHLHPPSLQDSPASVPADRLKGLLVY